MRHLRRCLVLLFSNDFRKQIAQTLVMKCHCETSQDNVVGRNAFVAFHLRHEQFQFTAFANDESGVPRREMNACGRLCSWRAQLLKPR